MTSPIVEAPGDLEKSTIRKVSIRLIPFLIVLYLVNFLDRTNVGFAADHMKEDIGLTSAVYGLGAGVFFLAYFLFEVPSNVLLEKFGARRWIARIMVTWGIVAGLMAFIQTPEHFVILRVLLGIAEAGFFPGVVFYLTLWFPSRYRAGIMATFYLGVPIAQVIGAPLSAILIQVGDQMGFQGWRLMYFVEAVPAVILGVVTWFYLTDHPLKAKWLSRPQQEWLTQTLAAERQSTVLPAAAELTRRQQVKIALTNRYVWALALVYFGITAGSNALNFFLPSVIKGLSDTFGLHLGIIQRGFVTAIPYAVAAVAMVLWTRRSDRKLERRWHAALPALIGAVTITIALLVDNPIVVILGFTVMAAGVYSAINVFWAIPSQFLTGLGAAAGIGLINSIGNLSGFVGPYVTGGIKQATGSYTPAFLVIAGAMFHAAIGLLLVMRKRPTSHPRVSVQTK
jgi:MFS family permease